MPKEFTDDDLQVHLDLGENWQKHFVKEHGRERPHGQMKLLCSNLLGLALVEEDMTRKKDKRSIELVVAGASPGTHMLVLLKHVEKWRETRGVRMHLYDPLPLDAKLQEIVDADESMSFERKPFTDEHAKRWKQSNEEHCVVFFSDIRSPIHSKWQHGLRDEVQIAEDMQTQKTWARIMRPDYCMLKFHAPHATDDNEQVQASFAYLRGVLYEQGYAGLFSAEYRLFCTKSDIKDTDVEYKTKEIERHAFYHTHRTRPSTFDVNNKHMQYDDAFAAHVARKAARWLQIDAPKLLEDAGSIGHGAHMHFAWPAAQGSRLQALHLRMLQIL